MSILFLLFSFLIILGNPAYSFNFKNKKDKKLSPDSKNKSKDKNQSEHLKGQFPSLKESGPDLITEIMSKYLSEYTPCTRDLCRRNTDTCHTLIKLYTDRCVAGDCYTLDFIKLIEFPNGFNLLAPNLTQFMFARNIFDVSKARQQAPFYNVYRNLYWEIKGNPRSLESFNKNLIRHNLQRLELSTELGFNSGSNNTGENSHGWRGSHEPHDHSGPNDEPGPSHHTNYVGPTDSNTNSNNNSDKNSDENSSLEQISNPENDRIILIESLYNFTLNYLTFLFRHPLLSEKCKYRFFRQFFRWIQRGKLIKIVRNVAKVKILSVGMRDLKNITDSYSLYLSTAPNNNHYRLNVSYTKLVKHALIKLTGEKRISYLMSDYLTRVPVKPRSYCEGSSPASCYQFVMDYLDRCEDGECILFSPRMLLDGKDPLNIGLPDLGQLDLALNLFVNSRAHKNAFIDFFLRRSGRISNNEFGDLILEKNTEKVKYSCKDHEVLYKYMYYATLNYKIWNLKGKLSKLFSKKIDKPLNDYLKELVESVALKLPKKVLEALFVAYRNYLFQSKLSENKDDVINYVQKCFDTLLPYKETTKVVKFSKKNKKTEEEEQENLYEPMPSFNWEKENLRDYEEGKWERIDPTENSTNLRTIEVIS